MKKLWCRLFHSKYWLKSGKLTLTVGPEILDCRCILCGREWKEWTEP